MIANRVEPRDQKDARVAKEGAQLITEQQGLVRRIIDVDKSVRKRRLDIDVTYSNSYVLVVLHDQVRIEGVLAAAANVIAGRRQQAADDIVESDQVQGRWYAEPTHRDRRSYAGSPESCPCGEPPRECMQCIRGGDEMLASSPLFYVGEDRDDQVTLIGHRAR